MKNAAVLRIAGDICLFFSVVSSFKFYAAYSPLMWIFLMLAILGLSAAVRMSRPALRLIPAVLPALAFFLCGSIYDVLILGAAFLYYFLTVILGRFDLRHWEYQRIFRVTLIFGTGVMAVAAARNMVWAVIFSFLFLLFGVIALRNLRMGMEMPMRWRRLNILEIFLPMGLALGASYLCWLFMRFLKNVLTVLMAPEIAGILVVEKTWETILWLLNAGLKPAPEEEESLVAESTEAATKAAEEIISHDTELPDWMEGIHVNWILVLLLVITAVTVVLIVIVVRRHRIQETPEYRFYEEGGKGGGRRRRKRRREREASNAERVRLVYRDYMALLSHYGVVARKDTTSGDLLRQSSDIFDRDPNAGLRAIYLKARYGRGETVTNEERETAERYLEEMRKTEGEAPDRLDRFIASAEFLLKNR